MDAYKDESGVSTIIAVLDTDGDTIVRVLANASANALKVSNGTTGTDQGNNGNNADRDGNHVPIFLAVSSLDGKTPVEVYADSSGNLLVDNA